MRDAAPLARRLSYNSNATTLDAQFLTKILLGFYFAEFVFTDVDSLSTTGDTYYLFRHRYT